LRAGSEAYYSYLWFAFDPANNHVFQRYDGLYRISEPTLIKTQGAAKKESSLC